MLYYYYMDHGRRNNSVHLAAQNRVSENTAAIIIILCDPARRSGRRMYNRAWSSRTYYNISAKNIISYDIIRPVRIIIIIILIIIYYNYINNNNNIIHIRSSRYRSRQRVTYNNIT